MDFFSAFMTDPALEEQGRPFDKEFGPNVTMILARSGNSTYNRMATQLYEAHKFTLDQKETEQDRKEAEFRNNEIMVEILAKTVLLGWSGDVMYDKQPLPYNMENAKKLLRMKDFRMLVEKLSGKFENYLLKREQEDSKNSETTSIGTSSGVVA